MAIIGKRRKIAQFIDFANMRYQKSYNFNTAPAQWRDEVREDNKMYQQFEACAAS